MRALLVAAAVVLAAVPTAAQQPAASVRVQVDRARITVDDTVTLRITAEGSFDDAREPSYADWDVISRSSSIQSILTPAGFRTTRVLTRVLAPRRAGTLAIGSVQLLRNGRVVASSNPIQVVVTAVQTPAPASPGTASDPRRYAGKPFFLIPVVSSRHIYEGQPFELSFELYVRSDAPVTDYTVRTAPRLEGFWLTDLTRGRARPRRRRRSVGRHVYTVFPLSDDLLVPLQPGKVTIDPMAVQVTVGDFFSAQRVTVRSAPLQLDIRPVPAQGRPPSFARGQVGVFQVRAKLDRAACRTGERVVLTVTVEGKGNLTGIKAPELPLPEGIEGQKLPGVDRDGIVEDASGIHGKVRFSYLLTPRRPGTYEIGPVRIGYFDPWKEKFGEALARPVKLRVEAATVPAAQTQAEARADRYRPLREKVPLDRTPPPAPGGVPLGVLLLFAVPPLGFAALEVVRAARRWGRLRAGERERRSAGARARRAIRALTRDRDLDARQFYDGVRRELVEYLSTRLEAPVGGWSLADLRAALRERGVPAELARRLVEELEHCEYARFAPGLDEQTGREETAERAVALVEALEPILRGGNDRARSKVAA